jgi:SAM-dependent methyltransferase
MYNLETEYWWFRNLHDMLTDMLRKHIREGDSLLDAGCGTGGFLLRLRELSACCYGFDLSPDAARYWHERGVADVTGVASINEIPYPDAHFDAVLSVDILECDGVHDHQAYGELARVTKPGGHVIVVVPAYQWMMTEGHHQAVHAVRRYNRHSIRALAAGAPVKVERVTHGFAALFPIIASTRLIHRWRERRGPVPVESELQPLSPLVNGALYAITNIERHLLRVVDMPFGSSLMMVARRI